MSGLPDFFNSSSGGGDFDINIDELTFGDDFGDLPMTGLPGMAPTAATSSTSPAKALGGSRILTQTTDRE
jgi:hypothetical protein